MPGTNEPDGPASGSDLIWGGARMLLPNHTLIQLSDAHIVPEGELLDGKVDSHASLVAALATVEESGLVPAALILSGDLADSGDPRAYQRLRETIEPVAARIGAPVLYVMGNHDERGAFRAGLLGASPDPGPCDYVHWSGDLRIIVLDSTVPGKAHGELSDAQLESLAGELAIPAPGGTILVLHHPPVPSPVAVLNLLLLRDPERLAGLVRGSDIRMILCGHLHHSSAGSLAGVPVWVSGAIAYGADPVAPAETFRGQAHGQFTRIDIYPESTVATAVLAAPGDTLVQVTAAQVAASLPS